MSAVVLVAKLRAANPEAAEKVKQYLAAIRDHALSDKEPGTKLYYPTRSTEDNLNFLVFEEYESKEAMQQHMASPIFGSFAAEVDSILEGGRKELQLNYYEQF